MLTALIVHNPMRYQSMYSGNIHQSLKTRSLSIFKRHTYSSFSCATCELASAEFVADAGRVKIEDFITPTGSAVCTKISCFLKRDTEGNVAHLKQQNMECKETHGP